jgi:hypothetical protein
VAHGVWLGRGGALGKDPICAHMVEVVLGVVQGAGGLGAAWRGGGPGGAPWPRVWQEERSDMGPGGAAAAKEGRKDTLPLLPGSF